jgi:hypothetical protein
MVIHPRIEVRALMEDRHGTTLSPGDPVLWYYDEKEEDAIPATVLREEAGGALIQRDQRDPVWAIDPRFDPVREKLTAALAEAGHPSYDSQEAFVVPSSALLFFGNWDDDGDELEDE